MFIDPDTCYTHDLWPSGRGGLEAAGMSRFLGGEKRRASVWTGPHWESVMVTEEVILSSFSRSLDSSFS